jgi:hypothetical protein
VADLAPLSVLKNLEVDTASRLPLPRRRFSFVYEITPTTNPL